MKPKLRVLILIVTLGASEVAAQAPGQSTGKATSPASTTSGMTTPSSPESESPYFGGVPSGARHPGKIPLTLAGAIDRGLKYNLALVLTEEDTRAARGARLKTLADLLPNLTSELSESSQTLDLAAFGFAGLKGFPTLVGPFSVFSARLYLSQSVFDWKTLHKSKASREDVKAAEFSYKDARDLVVLVALDLYLQAIAARSRVETARAEVKASQAVYNRAVDMKKSGVIPGIDVLRSEVELRAEQQRQIAVENDFEKAKLNLARAIGLPVDQEFELADKIPYSPLTAMPLEEALATAYRSRADYESAEARVRSAEDEKRAARGGGLPSLSFDADYGDIGPVPGQSHGTYTVAASLRVPIFQGGRVRGDVLEADALLKQRQAELADLRSRIEYQVRTAFLDLKASGDQVQVASQAMSLADEQLKEAEDRFSAGVVNSIEVVLAEEAYASAHENYISSLFAYNLAKGSLARALGIAETSATSILEGGH
ncbi:MAG: TolC family protein [Acidobacteria bacterium]|nr:MAG: TolC family protein [Acidobacteriota bacterium]